MWQHESGTIELISRSHAKIILRNIVQKLDLLPSEKVGIATAVM